MSGNDGFNVKVKTKVEGLDELKKAIEEFEAFKKTIDLSDRSIKDFVKEGDSAVRTLKDIERASQKVQTPEFAHWSEIWNGQIPEIKRYQKEIDKLELKLKRIEVDPETGKALDKNLQPALDSINKSYSELVANIHLARQVQNEAGREMGKLRGNGKEFFPIDYDALSEKARNATSSVIDAQTKITNALEEQAAAQKRAKEEADAAAHTQKSAYKGIDDTLWNVHRKLNELSFDARRLSSDVSKAKDILSRGGKIEGSDVEQYNDKLSALVKGSEEANKTIEEMARKIGELHLSDAMPDDIFKHLSISLTRAKNDAEELGWNLSEITPKGEETFGPIIEQLNEIKAVQEQINSLDIAKAIAFDDKGTIDTYNGLVDTINQLIEKLEKTIYVENTTIATNKNLQISWLMVDQLIDGIGKGLAKLKGGTAFSPELDAEYQNLHRLLTALKLKSKEYNDETKKSLGIETKSAKSKRELAHQVKSLSDGLNDAKKNMSKLGDAVSGVTKSIKSKMKHGLKSIMKYVLGFRSLFFLVRKLRSAIKEGLENLVQFDSANNETNKAISELRSSLLFVKNAWAAAFAPIINYVMPLLTSLIDMLAQVGNAIARFFAQLTGQATVLQAVKVDMGDYADSLKKAGSAAGGAAKKTKDLHDRLAPFDDLQVLGVDKDKDTSGSGGGGGGLDDMLPDPNEMFKRIQTESNLADMIKEAWKNQDFSGLGKLVGEKIRDGLNGIDWDSIKENLSSGITMVTSFINGLFTTEGLFSSLGTNAAEGINTFVSGLHQFIDEIEWHDILYGIGEGISDFLSTLDFGEVLLTIGDGIKSAIEGLSGFLEGIDLSDVLNNITTGIKDFFENFDWAGLFKDVGRLLGDVSVLVVQLVQWLSDAFANLLINIHEYLWPYIEPYLDSLPEDAGFFDIGIAVAKGMLEGILDGLKNIGKWLFDNVFKPIYDGICEAFEINSPSKVMEEIGNFIIEGILEGIKNLISKVPEPFRKLVNKILEIFRGLQSKAVTLWTALSNKLAMVVSLIKAILTEPFVKIKDFVVDTFTDLKDAVVGLWEDIWDGIKGIINTILSGIESFCNGIIDGVNSVLGLLKTVDKLPDAVKDYVGLDDFTIPSLSHISIPRLAQGAVIPPNKEFLAMLGDQKSGTNIEAPLDTIVNAFKEVMGSIQVEASNQVLQVDGQTFARLMTPYFVSELNRRGYNVKIIGG